MKITVITLTFNEAQIVPFFIRHYQPIADRIVFYDSGSTDGTQDIIREYPHVSLIETGRVGGEIDDTFNAHLKSTAYLDWDGDFFIAYDADEFIYAPELREYLEVCPYDLIQAEGWQMIGDEIPKDGLLTDHIKMGVRGDYSRRYFDKVCVFRPSTHIVFAEGAHSWKARPDAKLAPGKPVKLLHYKWLSREHVAQKVAALKLSQANIAGQFGCDRNGIPNSALWLGQYDQWRKERVRVLL